PVCSDEDRWPELEERHALPGNPFAPTLDQELGRPRSDAHLDPAAMRLLDDLDQLAVAEVGVGDDQLVDLARREHRGKRGECPEHRQPRAVPGVSDHPDEVVVDSAATGAERAPQPSKALGPAGENRPAPYASKLEQVGG